MSIDPKAYVLGRSFDLFPEITAEQAASFYAASPAFRREITKDDPLAFALEYLPHHLRSDETGGDITLSEFHMDLIERAKAWVRPNEKRQGRECFVAPRRSGKSTWSFLILPMWAAAHGHLKFIAAFSDVAAQAEEHLSTFRDELDNNDRLREDFPTLVKPMTRAGGGKAIADNRGNLRTANGFTFVARGVGTGSLGLKVGRLRPDLLIFDDIEPPEDQYSHFQMIQRRMWLEDAAFPLSETARVFITGTVTMTGSIIHQLVQHGRGVASEGWIEAQRIRVHYWPAILTDDAGERRSVWPERWDMEYLESIEHTRDYAKNFMNMPVPLDSAYWLPEHFLYGVPDGLTRFVLAVDPAVTTKRSSDQTALAVCAFSASTKKAVVLEAIGIRLRGSELRAHVARLLMRYPEISRIVVEANQGGDMWLDVLHDLPVKVVPFSALDSKEVRAARLLNHYQRGRILHARRFADLESEMIEFPNGLHDDLVDAVCHGIDALTLPNLRGRPPRVRVA